MAKEVPPHEGLAPTTSELLKLIRRLEEKVKKLEENERERRDALDRLRPL